MKKSAFLKNYGPEIQKQLKKFKRGHLYECSRKLQESLGTFYTPPQTKRLLLLTHFYKTGLRFKILSAEVIPHPGTTLFKYIVTIKPQTLYRFWIKEVPFKNVPLYMNARTPLYARYLENLKEINI